MKWIDAFRMAATGIWRNKLRSLLTMLGIFIGVAAVIILSSIGNGAQRQVTGNIETLGTNLIFITPANVPQFGNSQVSYIQKTTPMASSIIPVLSSHNHVHYHANVAKSSIIGTTPAWFRTHNSHFIAGSAWPSISQKLETSVVVLGSAIAQNLFHNTSAIGHTVMIFGQPFRVVGQLHRSGTGWEVRKILKLLSR